MAESGDEIRDAATVITLRNGGSGLEVFMVRRHPDHEFMAERYVYPGGAVDEEDCRVGAATHVEGLTPDEAIRRFGGDVGPRRALGHYLAGVRESFEEAGFLFAQRADQANYVNLVDDADRRERFDRAREDLARGELSLTEFADCEDLVLMLDRMAYAAHWITPRVEGRRYDTRFFLALAPERQEPLHDAHETTDGIWIRPGDALDRNRDREILLAPPTLCTLRQLVDFSDAREALEWARRRRPTTRLPHVGSDDAGDVVLYLPGDPEYPEEETEYGRAEPDPDGPTRLRMAAPGRWEPV